MNNNSTQTHFDAIVVGSGISGGWAAKELTEKGLKVLVLERGSELRHSVDYLGEHVPDWDIPFQGKGDRELYQRDYEIQHNKYAFSEATRHYFNNDRENPYVRNEEKPFDWYRTDVVGGRSLIWGRQTYRFSEQDFNANKQDKHGIPWPISYQDIAPWYSYVEKFIGVSGQAEGLPQLPDSEFQPPMAMHALEKTIKARLQEHAPYAHMTMGRVAILTENLNGRGACHYCGPCHRGCSTGSYFSSQSSTLPAATATGNLTLRPNSVVEKLVYDKNTGRISEVQVIDSQTRERLTFSAKLFFMCASTVGTTQILLNSACAEFPNGLANSSGALGHYLMDHMSGTVGVGLFLDNTDRYFSGNRPTGTYIPRFRNLEADDDTDFVRGYGIQASVNRSFWRLSFNRKGLGSSYKDKLRKPGPLMWSARAFAECLPQKSNRIDLHASKVDRFGIPQVSPTFEWSSNEKTMWKDALTQGQKLQKAAGAAFIFPGIDATKNPGGEAVHEMGTARMGDDPRESVLNAHNQSHDIPNLFVTDGSAMTSSSCVNPSLTYMALTARACDYAVKQLKAGNV